MAMDCDSQCRKYPHLHATGVQMEAKPDMTGHPNGGKRDISGGFSNVFTQESMIFFP